MDEKKIQMLLDRMEIIDSMRGSLEAMQTWITGVIMPKSRSRRK